MALDWSQCPVVERIPGKVSGAWVFRGTRLPVSTVFENLEAGASVDEIAEWFDVSLDRIKAVLEFAENEISSSQSKDDVARSLADRFLSCGTNEKQLNAEFHRRGRAEGDLSWSSRSDQV